MGWASGYIAQLRAGTTIQCRPRGNSMQGKIESGQLCTIVPVGEDGIDPSELKKNDIVLCKVGGNEYLHIISAIQGQRFQISNNRGHVNGWISANNIFGKCTNVET